MQLVVLAAGVGSRFGGPKQWTALPGTDRTLLELSLVNACGSGFERIVLIVSRTQTLDRLEKRLPARSSIEQRIQRIDDLPHGLRPASRRKKPLGTGHAAWAARDAVDGPFVLINADDWYGPAVFERLAAHLREGDSWALAGYRLADTLTPHGGVNRAICDVGPDGLLRDLQEWTDIREEKHALRGRSPRGTVRDVDPESRVSMNAWALRPDVFPLLERGLVEFLSGEPGDDAEYHLPHAIASAVRDSAASVRVLEAGERWLGITYPQDADRVARALEGAC